MRWTPLPMYPMGGRDERPAVLRGSGRHRFRASRNAASCHLRCSRPTPAAIGGLLEGGGFSKVAVEQDEVTFEFDSPEHFTAYIRAISAPIRAMIEQHAGGAQEEAWDAITQAAAGAGGGSKPLSFSNVVLLASATA